MDGIVPVPEIARELAVSPERVRRTAAELGIALVRIGGGANATSVVTSQQHGLLRAAIGVVRRDLPRRWARADIQVLAALASAPRGLVSARAVARRAGLSPMTAIKSLSKLEAQGLVRRALERIALGTVQNTKVFRIDRSSALWKSLAPVIARTYLPARETLQPKRVPNELLHLFWNTHWDQLFLDAAANYIARRLISTGDADGLAWGATHLDADAWLHAAKTRGLSVRRRRLAKNIAASLQ